MLRCEPDAIARRRAARWPDADVDIGAAHDAGAGNRDELRSARAWHLGALRRERRSIGRAEARRVRRRTRPGWPFTHTPETRGSISSPSSLAYARRVSGTTSGRRCRRIKVPNASVASHHTRWDDTDGATDCPDTLTACSVRARSFSHRADARAREVRMASGLQRTLTDVRTTRTPRSGIGRSGGTARSQR